MYIIFAGPWPHYTLTNHRDQIRQMVCREKDANIVVFQEPRKFVANPVSVGFTEMVIFTMDDVLKQKLILKTEEVRSVKMQRMIRLILGKNIAEKRNIRIVNMDVTNEIQMDLF